MRAPACRRRFSEKVAWLRSIRNGQGRVKKHPVAMGRRGAKGKQYQTQLNICIPFSKTASPKKPLFPPEVYSGIARSKTGRRITLPSLLKTERNA
jgi:hypothetical protein